MIYCYNPCDPYMGIVIEDEDNPDFVKIKSFVYSNDLGSVKEAVSEIITDEIDRMYERASDLKDLLNDIEMMEEES